MDISLLTGSRAAVKAAPVAMPTATAGKLVIDTYLTSAVLGFPLL
jgi:hypothetical protein